MALPNVAPLSSRFMAASIIGFFISVYYIMNFMSRTERCQSCETWGFAFAFLFALMFIASMISMSRSMTDEELSPRPRRKKK